MTKQIFSFYFLLQERAKPIPPLSLCPSSSAHELKPFTPPLSSALPSARELKPLLRHLQAPDFFFKFFLCYEVFAKQKKTERVAI